MAKPKIRLSLWNSDGAVAGIEDDDMGSIDLVLHKSRQDAKTICKAARDKLRRLADAFDRLSAMDDPFKEKTQREAERTSSR
jgi:hypothetical protein